MLPKNGLLIVSAMVLTTLPSAMAQYGGAALAVLNDEDASVVQGRPFAEVARLESVTPAADGIKITKLTERRKWRDSQGRFRLEVTVLQSANGTGRRVAAFFDPVANTVTTLDPVQKKARVVHLPDGTLRPFVEWDDRPVLARPGVTVKREKLIGQQIDGVYVIGRRVIRSRPPGTVANDKTLVSVAEEWMSPDLKIVLASSTDDPRDQQQYKVTDLKQNEPDPSLFAIPPGYSVEEAKGDPANPVIMRPY